MFAKASAFIAAAAFCGSATALPQSVNAAGYCLEFDGADDLVQVTRSVALEPAQITVELWARLDGQQGWNSRLLRKGETDAYYITADQDLDNRMQLLAVKNNVFVQAKDTSPHSVYSGHWHHFTGVYAADHAEFWVDGVQVSSVTHAQGPLSHLPLTDLFIGAGLPAAAPEFFHGRIDEVRVWNFPRSAVEIQADWNLSLSGSEVGLVAYWRFDEGLGQVAADSALFGLHGQLGLTSSVDDSDPAWLISDVPLGSSSCIAGTYCIGAPNSKGKSAYIGYLGGTSIAANELVLTVNACRPNQTGVFFFGKYATQIPFGEGFLCVTGHQRRLLPVLAIDASGSAVRALDFENPLMPESIISAGSDWNFQFWYRDPQIVGHGFNFSNALSAHFCP